MCVSGGGGVSPPPHTPRGSQEPSDSGGLPGKSLRVDVGRGADRRRVPPPAWRVRRRPPQLPLTTPGGGAGRGAGRTPGAWRGRGARRDGGGRRVGGGERATAATLPAPGTGTAQVRAGRRSRVCGRAPGLRVPLTPGGTFLAPPWAGASPSLHDSSVPGGTHTGAV